MVCASWGALVLTATLLGQQNLTLESQTTILQPDAKAKACVVEAPEHANATFMLKDAKGVKVYEAKVSVPRFRYYTHDERENQTTVGGVFPAKQAVVTFKYPLNDQTNRATSVELKMNDGTFWKQAMFHTNVKSKMLIGLK